MNKEQFIARLADQFDGNRAEAGRALNAVLDTVTQLVVDGQKVSLTGFGAFDKVHRPARLVRNPRDGSVVAAGETWVPRFRAGADLREATETGAAPTPKPVHKHRPKKSGSKKKTGKK